MRIFLLILGTLSALLILGQLVMGRLLVVPGPNYAMLRKSHEHSGYLTVVVVLVYIVFSLIAIASTPRRENVG